MNVGTKVDVSDIERCNGLNFLAKYENFDGLSIPTQSQYPTTVPLQALAPLRYFVQELFGGDLPDAQDAIFAAGSEEIAKRIRGESKAESFSTGKWFLIEANRSVAASAGHGIADSKPRDGADFLAKGSDTADLFAL